jgi:signal transduction histidine kinase
MKRPWLIWLSFGLCVAVVLAAMGWISQAALDSEASEAKAAASEAKAIARAEYEEDVRLALWRMDYLLGSVLAQESAQPFFAFAPPDRAGAQTTLPKNLPRHVKLHFRYSPDGQVTSPWVLKNAKAKTGTDGLPLDLMATAERRLGELCELVRYAELEGRLPEKAGGSSESLVLARDNVAMEPSALNQSREGNFNEGQAAGRNRRGDLQQSQLSNAEFQARHEGFQRLVDTNRLQGTLSIKGDVRVGEMTPVWFGDQLLLARRVRTGGSTSLQGAWLDWHALRDELLAVVADKFPAASLRPVVQADDETVTRERRLAVLPLEFVPGEPPEDGLRGAVRELWTPLRISLGVAWGCVLVAAAAVALLLAGVLRLSERRAAFVSAVTHELRTPLTTFRMYADMLARGMVSQPERQQHYLNTLRVESDRLTHLVANVLSYARLERGRPVRELQTVPLGELVMQTQARLADRAAQAGLELRVAVDSALAGAAVRCDPSVVEQVLFNLVDNACKYAAGGLPPVVELSAGRAAQGVVLRVRDHGPGIAPGDRRRVFRTFGKSAHQAANSAPGVGLGLGLSRRLARAMGGDLRLEPKNGQGAAFVLTLRGD